MDQCFRCKAGVAVAFREESLDSSCISESLSCANDQRQCKSSSGSHCLAFTGSLQLQGTFGR